MRSPRLLALLFVAIWTLPAAAQSPLWSDLAPSDAASRPDLSEHRAVRFDLEAVRAVLPAEGESASVVLPQPEGGTATVRLTEAPVMAPALQARYPSIRTYLVSGEANGRIAVTPHGLSALLFDEAGTMALDATGPMDARDARDYAVYRPSSLVVSEEILQSLNDDVLHREHHHEHDEPSAMRQAIAIGETLRTYRLAAAARAEFTLSRGGTVELGLAGVVASVNRANAIFERDLALRFELVPDNDRVIYTDPDTDPFEGSGFDLFDFISPTLDMVIGPENFDIGHLLTVNDFGGAAFLAAACDDLFKAEGFSSVNSALSAFDLLVFPHELGHQLGADHAFVRPDDRFGDFELGVEPGPGYTIMSYPHFALYRPGDERIGFHFHSASIEAMNAHVRGPLGSCGTDTPTGNDLPVVTVDRDLITVPLGAFVTLSGSATDASGTALSYTWEQIDTFGDGTGAVPRVRALAPGPSPRRTLPDLRRFLDGTPFPDELPLDQDAVYTFRLTARDNAPGGGAQASAITSVRVRTADGPFEITSIPTGASYPAGDALEVQWSVAGSDSGEIGAATVDVLVSTDDGQTWDLAAEAVPNDGSHRVTLPASATSAGRLMVRAAEQPFFAVTPSVFEITGAVANEGATGAPEVTVSSVSPNPASGRATVRLDVPTPTLLRLSVIDAVGREVADVWTGSVVGGLSLPLDVSRFSAGVYLLRVEGDGVGVTRRFTVAR
ncbi:MAG: reprolysin-like metallopeptidase [Bacteroidota bacterium]